jgi:hypothetical protein
MKKFKVVIKKNPQMKYGGQSQYGLNTGPRNVYSEMPENPNENLNSIEVDEIIHLYCSIGYKLENSGYDSILVFTSI